MYVTISHKKKYGEYIMAKMKELSQADYQLEIVEDLGMVGDKRKVRRAIFKCGT